jgi:alpha-galactosidase
LIDHGWQYVNIDDGWQGKRTPPTYALQANEKFPDMKNLCDYVHNLGLKIGIYSTPWKRSYGGYPGGSTDTDDGRTTNRSRRVGAVRCETRDAWQYAQWGIDYLKYDWHVIDVHNTTLMLNALKASGRDIAYSLSNSAPFDKANEWARLANAWRTTGDIRDTWPSMSRIGFDQNKWKPFAGPGHWNDPDMLVVGWVGWGNPHPSRLTPNEQYTHISLWCLLSAPLLLGNDMTKLDDFTISLLSNDEVLDVNQDPLGDQAAQVSVDDKKEVWAKTMEDGSKAVGLFNRGLFPVEVSAKWSDLGITGKQVVRDLWRQKDLGTFEEEFKAEIPRHGVVLVLISAAE